MAQTKFGAAKVAARHYGLSLEDYLAKIQTEKSCKACKEWKPRENFCSDRGSRDGLGKSCFACRRVKTKRCTKGRTTWMRGKKHTEESKAKMRVKDKGRRNTHRIGAVHTVETKAIISKKLRISARRGPANHNWKGGVSPEEKRIRKSAEYCDWRKVRLSKMWR
jgi:SRSO17 transposase